MIPSKIVVSILFDQPSRKILKLSLDPINGKLTNLVHEDLLPNQKRNMQFLPVGEPVPDRIKVTENPVSCLFFFHIHELLLRTSTSYGSQNAYIFILIKACLSGGTYFISNSSQMR